MDKFSCPQSKCIADHFATCLVESYQVSQSELLPHQNVAFIEIWHLTHYIQIYPVTWAWVMQLRYKSASTIRPHTAPGSATIQNCRGLAYLMVREKGGVQWNMTIKPPRKWFSHSLKANSMQYSWHTEVHISEYGYLIKKMQSVWIMAVANKHIWYRKWH